MTVYWLGKTVAGKYKGPSLDLSAFSALVHSHGNKDVISDDSFRNGSPVKDSPKHIRDSSYDSLGSYERESESSFDELDSSGTMPVRSDMREMRRYGSASSLSMPRDLRLSTASGESMYSDDKHDSMYVSSPDLSQGSHAHTRSSSTDSMEGNYYGNHSRQSSGSTDNYATRRTSTSTRKTSTSTPDPLQFVKLKGAENLAAQAKKQMEVAKEVNMMRGKVDSVSSTDEPDWQSVSISNMINVVIILFWSIIKKYYCGLTHTTLLETECHMEFQFLFIFSVNYPVHKRKYLKISLHIIIGHKQNILCILARFWNFGFGNF